MRGGGLDEVHVLRWACGLTLVSAWVYTQVQLGAEVGEALFGTCTCSGGPEC